MLIDTHCHINMMVKKEFDVPLTSDQLLAADSIIQEAYKNDVYPIINVGTRHVENKNCLLLAQRYEHVFATVGIHPNDSDNWRNDLKAMQKWVEKTSSFAKASNFVKTSSDKSADYGKIVGIGECGIDRHYPNHNLQQQYDAFKGQIELALTHDLALVIHSRDAYDETLRIMEEYKNDIGRATMHCFSYDKTFADIVTSWNCVLGIGGTITYPKNDVLKDVVQNTDIKNIVLETDAPFLPIQAMRGKQNHPRYIKDIAEYIAQLRNESFDYIAHETTKNALGLFGLEEKYVL